VENTCQHVQDKIQASSFEEAFFSSTQTYIHPTAIIGSQVKLGNNVKIGPFCTVIGNVTIGDNTRLHANVNIGFPGQVLGLKDSIGSITIGNNCELREFVTIHGSRNKDGATKIGNNCYLMNFAHVSHDGVLEDNVTLINNVSLGGHTHIEKNAIVMANSASHQFCRIGQYTALAPFSGIRQDLPPYCLFSGQPARFYGLNVIGLRRAGISRDSINALKHVTKLFFQDKLSLDEIYAQAQTDQTWGNDQYVHVFLSFIKNSSRGVSRKCGLDTQTHNNEAEVSW
jgi:UDP-N-acetylglucosamine acyltransferase